MNLTALNTTFGFFFKFKFADLYYKILIQFINLVNLFSNALGQGFIDSVLEASRKVVLKWCLLQSPSCTFNPLRNNGTQKQLDFPSGRRNESHSIKNALAYYIRGVENVQCARCGATRVQQEIVLPPQLSIQHTHKRRTLLIEMHTHFA